MPTATLRRCHTPNSSTSGGANSIRAFTVRSLGPGSYHAPKMDENGYFDQTGTFKLEFNTEYRFPLISILHGALFLDAGKYMAAQG